MAIPPFWQKLADWLNWLCPVRSALKRTPVQDFNYFSITFYCIISITYQKIGDLFCLIHISGLSHSVGRAFFSPRVRLNCSCQVVGHNRSSSLRYDQDFFVPIFCSHRYFMLTFLSGLSFDVCLYIPAHSNRVALQSKSCVNPKTKCTPSVIFTIVPKVKCFLKSIRQVIYKTHCRYGVRNSSIKTLVIWNLAYTLE